MASILGNGKSISSLGLIEFRASYGAFFITIGVLGVYFNIKEVDIIIGSSLLSAGLVRLIFFFYKRKNIKENAAGVFVELGIAGLIFVG